MALPQRSAPWTLHGVEAWSPRSTTQSRPESLPVGSTLRSLGAITTLTSFALTPR